MTDLTPAQRAWLTKLRDDGPQESHTRTGFYCRTHGLTEWCFVHNNGSRLGHAEIEARFQHGHEAWHMAKLAGWTVSDMEQITPAGLAALKAAEQEDNDD